MCEARARGQMRSGPNLSEIKKIKIVVKGDRDAQLETKSRLTKC